MRVRCIDDTGTAGALTNGQVYEVVKELVSHYTLKGVKTNWLKTRFDILTLPCPAPAYPCADPFTDISLPKPAALPIECKCGILRSMCDYHKDCL